MLLGYILTTLGILAMIGLLEALYKVWCYHFDSLNTEGENNA